MVDDKVWIIAKAYFYAFVDGKRKQHRYGRRYKFPLRRVAEFIRYDLVEIAPPVEVDDDDSD